MTEVAAPAQATTTHRRLILTGLILGVTAAGTSGYVVAGVLPAIASDLGVSVAAAGQLATAWALTVAFAGPVITALTLRRSPKSLLLAMTALFCIGTLGTALAPTYGIMLVCRVVAAASQCTFFAVALVVAVSLFPAEQAGRAIGAVSSGLAFATVIGVPVGTFAGREIGWRATFLVLLGLGVATLVVIAAGTPPEPASPQAPLDRQIGSLLGKELISCFGLTLTAYCGVFATFTYLGSLLESHQRGPDTVVLVLAVFGLGGLVGSHTAGRRTDAHPKQTLLIALGLLCLSAALLQPALTSVTATSVLVFAFGAAAFATVPVLQGRVLALAVDAPNLAVATNVGVFNLADGTGAALGGVVVATLGLNAAPWASAVVAGIGLAAAAALLPADRRRACGDCAVEVS
ncbi:MFS transporter [Flexivirga sp. B27]